MQRRQVLRHALALATLGAPLTGRSSEQALPQDMAPWLERTRFIDHDHPSIRAVVEQAAPVALPPVERAVRLHDFVRDRVPFGWSPAFYDETASQVLASGVGFCNTKGTLFTALLRAAGLPARQHFVDIHADILFPFIDPGTDFVDHSFTEVHLGGRWLAVDSYIVDRPLERGARARLASENRVLGYGLHADGRSEWDGGSEAFAQFVRNGRWPTLSRRDHGVHRDIGAFIESGLAVNRLNALLRIGFGFFAGRANRRIAALRA